MRIDDLLRRNALRIPDERAVICPAGTTSWRQLDRRVNRLASSLQRLGHRPQERVALVMQDCHHIVESYYALWKDNLVSVALSPRLSEEEIARTLVHSGASAIITDSATAVAAAAGVPTVQHVIALGDLAGGTHGYEELMAAGSEADLPRLGSGADLRSLRYTSGTTGRPKGCMATHAQQLASVANFLIELDVPRSGPTSIPLPLSLGVGAFHLTALSYLGAPLLITTRFKAADWLDAIVEHQVVHAFIVTTQVVDVLAELSRGGDRDLTSLKLLGYGGSPISWDVVRQLREALPCGLYMGLGATEAGGQVTLLTPADHDALLARAEPGTMVPVGRAAAYAQVRIVGPDGSPLPPGEQGELEIRSASTFSGYWGQPEETRLTIRDGWLALGDIARLDEHGYVHLVDRRQGVIRSGSQNIYAAEIEAVLQSIPDVNRAAVLGIPDDRLGEVVGAVVVPAAGAELTAAQLLRHLDGRLARFKHPRAVLFVDDIPINENGKVVRSQLTRFLSDLVGAR